RRSPRLRRLPPLTEPFLVYALIPFARARPRHAPDRLIGRPILQSLLPRIRASRLSPSDHPLYGAYGAYGTYTTYGIYLRMSPHRSHKSYESHRSHMPHHRQMFRGEPLHLPSPKQAAQRQSDYARNKEAASRIAAHLILDVGLQLLRLHLTQVVSRAFQPIGGAM